MVRRVGVFAVVFTVLASSGCVMGRSVAESSRPVKAGEYDTVGPARGSCWSGYVYILNLIPVRFGDKDQASHARDEALIDSGVAPAEGALVNVSVEDTIAFLPIPLLSVWLTVTTVEGDVVKLHEPKPEAKPEAKKEAKPEAKPKEKAK